MLSILVATLAWADEPRFFRIGTAGTTGTYFQIGGILASAISSPSGSPNCQRGGNCGVPGLIAVAQATQGSVENIGLIGRGQLESALAQANIASWAYHGTAIFKSKGAMTNLRAIAALFPESIHLVVLKDSPINSLRDLKGKRVGLGEKESGTLADARIVLEAAGLSERDLKPDYSRLGEAAAGIREKTLDAFFLVGGYPIPAIAELAATTPIRLVAIGDETIDKLKKRYPFFTRATIPVDAYPGLDGETPTLGLNALWIVAASVPDQLVYEITKSLWSEPTRKFLTTRHIIGRRIAPERALEGIDIPLHPGAERYYRENFLLTDAPK
jgi:TRAP transporter TAXI family solute receptor